MYLPSRGSHLDATRIDIRRFHAHAWAATLSVVVLPALSVLSLLFFVEPDPPVLAVSAISLLISAAASFFGSHLWMRREESVEVSFSDLMLWTWWKRQRAEARVLRGAELLGLDASGQPVSDQPVIGRKERLRILHELSAALESKDPYTHGHSQRVERHSFRIGAALGLSVTDLEDLRLAAALHDVGKIRVSDRILRKPGKLTPEEYKEIQDHSVVGAWMVSSVGNPDVISAVRHHHERFDGAGYPDGISGHDIPLFARIIGVADAFDAITSSRPYRARSERERAVRIIKEESGKQFDPMVVEAFLSSLPAAAPVTAALAFLLPGSAGMLRKIATVAKDMGGAGVAETVRAAGVTVVLSASVVAPVSQYVSPDRHRTAEVVQAEQKLMSSSEVPGAPAAAAASDVQSVQADAEEPGKNDTPPTKDGAVADPAGFSEIPAVVAADELSANEAPADVLGSEAEASPVSGGASDDGSDQQVGGGTGSSGNSGGNGNGNGPPSEPGNGNGGSSSGGSGNSGGNGGGNGNGNGPPEEPGNPGGNGGGSGPSEEPGDNGNGNGPPEEPGNPGGNGGGSGPREEPGDNGNGPAEEPGNSGGSGGPPDDPGNSGGNGGGNSDSESPGNAGGNGGGQPKG